VAHITGNLPVFDQWDISANAAQTIVSFYDAGNPAPQFHMFRAVLVSPSDIAGIVQQVQSLSPSVILLGPLQLAYLARVAFGGTNDDRVAYVADTIPPALPSPPPATLSFSATLRNDGWNAWAAVNHSLLVTFTAAEALAVHPGIAADAFESARVPATLALPMPTAPSLKAGWLRRHGRVVTPLRVAAGLGAGTLCPLPGDLPPGGSVTVNCTVPWPAATEPTGATAATAVTLQYQLAALTGSGGVAFTFDANGNIPWQATVVVGA
jgi:hypothetical protein